MGEQHPAADKAAWEGELTREGARLEAWQQELLDHQAALQSRSTHRYFLCPKAASQAWLPISICRHAHNPNDLLILGLSTLPFYFDCFRCWRRHSAVKHSQIIVSHANVTYLKPGVCAGLRC